MVLARLPCNPLVVDPVAIGVALFATCFFYLYVASYRRKHLDLRGLLPRTVRRRRALFRTTQTILAYDLAKIGCGLVLLHIAMFFHELLDAAIRGHTATSQDPLAGGAYYLPSHVMRTLIDIVLVAIVGTTVPWPLLVKFVGRTSRVGSAASSSSCWYHCRDALRVPGRYSQSVLLGWDNEACIDFRIERDGAEANEDNDEQQEPGSDVEVNDRARLVRPVVRDGYQPQRCWWLLQTLAWSFCLAITAGAAIVPQLILVAAARAGDPVSLFIRYVVPTSMATVVCGTSESLGIDWKEDSVLVGGSWSGTVAGHFAVDVLLICWLHWMLQYRGRITHEIYGEEEPVF